jgi:uncharacterized 2Fe-2S/4Fe-4S cluster protein (DUF4445 family)
MASASHDSICVEFQPEGRYVHVLPGTSLLEAAGRADIVIETPCGGLGTCGKCRVEVLKNAPPPTGTEQRHLSPEEIERGVRLACGLHVAAEMTVHVPIAIRYSEHRILTNGLGREVPLHPTVDKRRLKLPPPGLNDQRADADRLLDALGEPVEPELGALRELPDALRASDFEVTAVTAEGRLIAIEPGDTTSANYGIAFDIGTTTVVGFLLDLSRGRELAVSSCANPQITLGHDVVSRIRHAERDEGLIELQRRIVEGLNELIAECCRKAHIPSDHLYEATIACNTTMSHLFLGITPRHLAQAPYVAAHRKAVTVTARDAGLHIHPHGLVHVLPNIASFVGSDTVAVILASALHESPDVQVAIDIGTNGEIVVGNRDRLIAGSTAAGPAFEGARIRCGLRAVEGAIDKIVISDDVEYNVIGNALPKGICGTALIDAVAELLRVGAVDPTGRLLPPDEMPPSVPDAVRKRISRTQDGLELLIVPAEESAAGEPVVLTQRDVRELQLGKGAIAAGTAILMKEYGIGPGGLKHVLLAGAFGNFIRRKNAQRIGLLPNVPRERILFIGNAAGAGARMALMSRRCKDEANAIAERIQYVELAGRPDFADAFADAMMFPEA